MPFDFIKTFTNLGRIELSDTGQENIPHENTGHEKIGQQNIDDFLEAVAARKSTPGGGAVAAVCAAQACSLVTMVARFTRGNAEMLSAIAERANNARVTLVSLADEDVLAFEALMKCYREYNRENQTPEAIIRIDSALVQAAHAPRLIIRITLTLINDLKILSEIGNPNLMTDVAISATLFKAALNASELNVRVNSRALSDKLLKETLEEDLINLASGTGVLEKLALHINTQLR